MAFIEPGRSRSLSAYILGIGLALLFVWPSAHVRGQEPGGGPVNLDVILLIDNSMSMSHADLVTGAPPSDPEGLRVRAAKFLVDYLRANAETSRANHRAGVVSFGGVVGDVASLRLLQENTVRDGIRAEEIQFTDFRTPLQFALREFRAKSFATENRMAVVLFTDGRPQLTGTPMAEQELRDYFDDLAPLAGELQEGGVSLFVLGIGDAREDRDNWTRLIPQNHYIPITSTTELFDVYHRIVADLIGVAVSKERILPAEQAVSIKVEPYLERIVFSFVKSDPATRISLTSPTGTVLTPTIGAADVHHSIYSIT
ncbi:MAG: VWA domain-containing protein, partial [Anaerolineae bacterium]|nr:VWA domain-containing protein [Anaerolineae bacterium]